MLTRRYLALLGGVTAIFVLVTMLLFPRAEFRQYNIQEKAKEWNVQIYASRISSCKEFSTVEEALTHFGLPGPLEKCKEDTRRLIRFYDEGNIHGFLTCYPVGEKYFCCAQLAEGYTKDYNTWKARCS